MAHITVDRDSSYRTYLICLVDEQGEWSTRDDSRTILVQTDWDYPSLASAFGWNLSAVQTDPKPRHWKTGEEFVCEHGGTDGTVKCEVCGLTAGDFIAAAGEYLEEHLGDIVEDPGYFLGTKG